MVESGLIAEGSSKGLIGGTHFNRCKRIHPIAALSIKTMHFEQFLNEYLASSHDKKLDITEVFDIIDSDAKQPQSNTIFELNDILEQYEAYTKKTLNGDHGLTAKYAMLYVRFIDFYQLFERAIRTSDLDLFIYSAYSMCPLFFIFNHHNYARWLTRNLDNLINIETTHPGLKTEFENGAMSVRRTPKNFCRSPIDLTLEQTINANAANKLKGISAFTNSLNARHKWSETHSTRMAIITELMEFLGLNKSSEAVETSYHSKIFRNQVRKFSEEMRKTINPFDDGLNPSNLFNLSSGKAASVETANFLLNVENNGFKQMKDFINECKVDAKHFEKPLKRNNMKNFSVEEFKGKNSKVKNIDQAKAERNVLGQMLCLALANEIEVLTLFSHPLTTVPHSLAHFDGTMIANKKDELTNLLLTLTSDGQHNDCPTMYDVDIIDGFYLFNNFRGSPTRYGEFAKFALQKICDTPAKEVHIFFYKREEPSPRDVETKKQMQLYDSGQKFSIKGDHQERSQSLDKCLPNASFREELINFFIDFWARSETTNHILGEKRVFVSFGSKCYLFSNEHEKGKLLTRFENNHFELESKMILHIYKMQTKNIRVVTSNADSVFVHLLYHMQFWGQNREVVIEMGDATKNIKQINVRKVFKTLTPMMLNALPSWTVFTGCIYEPAFYRKGKKTCMKALKNNMQAQNAFAAIGIEKNGNDERIAVLEGYTCSLYGQKTQEVNQARASMFKKIYDDPNIIKKGNLMFCRSVL